MGGKPVTMLEAAGEFNARCIELFRELRDVAAWIARRVGFDSPGEDTLPSTDTEED